MSKPPIVNADAAGIERAAAALGAGRLVGLPTETVYGLAADARSADAVARVFAAKGRPSFNPLIAHVDSLASAEAEGVFDTRALQLAEAFWPGPLTLIVPARDAGSVCELARAGLTSIGLRVPGHPVARELLRVFGHPLAAPSANPSGGLSPTSPGHVAGDLDSPDLALVLDGGACASGIESTIVAVVPGETPALLRPGIVERERIESTIGPLGPLGPLGSDEEGSSIRAPGQLISHYAPQAALRLNALEAAPGERLLGFGPEAPASAANLSAVGDPVEAAANLYRLLRELDADKPERIAVMPIPESGLGEAINDRLRRAAAPRAQVSSAADSRSRPR